MGLGERVEGQFKRGRADGRHTWTGRQETDIEIRQYKDGALVGKPEDPNVEVQKDQSSIVRRNMLVMPEVGGNSVIPTAAGAVSVHTPPTEQAPIMMEVITHANPHRSKVLPPLQESIQYASTVVEIKPDDIGHTGESMPRVRIPHNAADPSALMLLSAERRSDSEGLSLIHI